MLFFHCQHRQLTVAQTAAPPHSSSSPLLAQKMLPLCLSTLQLRRATACIPLGKMGVAELSAGSNCAVQQLMLLWAGRQLQWKQSTEKHHSLHYSGLPGALLLLLVPSTQWSTKKEKNEEPQNGAADSCRGVPGAAILVLHNAPDIASL